MIPNQITKKISRSSTKKEEKQLRQLKFIQLSSSNYSKQQISILLYYQQRQNPIQQLLLNQTVYVNQKDQIQLSKLIQTLRIQSFLTYDCSLSYQDSNKGVYVYCGDTKKNQTQKFKNIPLKCLTKNNQLKLKIRKNKKSLVENLLDQQKDNLQKDMQNEKGPKKQKRIGQVLEKVALWRKFYTGFYDQRRNFVQKPLEQAATQVGIAKKTLDDYLLQIRCGKKYGFNFNDNINAKIGQLRAFVRDSKKKQLKQ